MQLSMPLLAFIFCIVQMLAMAWYCLSYIPFARCAPQRRPLLPNPATSYSCCTYLYTLSLSAFSSEAITGAVRNVVT